jgi:hypothetical protein
LKIPDKFSFPDGGITEFDRKKRLVRKTDTRYYPVDNTDGFLTSFLSKKEINVSFYFCNIAVFSVGILHLNITDKLVIHEVCLRHDCVGK